MFFFTIENRREKPRNKITTEFWTVKLRDLFRQVKIRKIIIILGQSTALHLLFTHHTHWRRHCTKGTKSVFACAAVEPSLCLCRELCFWLRSGVQLWCLLSTLPSSSSSLSSSLPTLRLCDSALVRRLAAALAAVANVSAKRVNVIWVFRLRLSGRRRFFCCCCCWCPAGQKSYNKKVTACKNFANENMNITENNNDNRKLNSISIKIALSATCCC